MMHCSAEVEDTVSMQRQRTIMLIFDCPASADMRPDNQEHFVATHAECDFWLTIITNHVSHFHLKLTSAAINDKCYSKPS